MTVAEILLEYLKVLLNWPVVILCISLLLIYKFRQPFSSFLSRLIKAEAYGAKVEASVPERQQAHVPKEIGSRSEIEQHISKNPGEFIDRYFKLFEAFVFEKIFNTIYGTQVSLLESLSLKKDEGEKYNNLTEFYQEFLRRGGTTSYHLRDYLNFLTSYKLIDFHGEGSETTVKITPSGNNFLSYIKANYSLLFNLKPL
jgi:hypothetical protein